MILTNDGDWANRVVHPRYGNEREYAALVAPAPTRAVLKQLRDGVTLDDGPARLLDARFAASAAGGRARARTRRASGSGVRIGEGRKREVRRLFAAVDARVERLVRTRIGPLGISGLRIGQWRLPSSGRGRGAGRASGVDDDGGRHRRAVRCRQEHRRPRAGAPDRRALRRHRAHVSRAHPGGAGAGDRPRRRRRAGRAGRDLPDRDRASGPGPERPARDRAARRARRHARRPAIRGSTGR